jgi:hypothetical protein
MYDMKCHAAEHAIRILLRGSEQVIALLPRLVGLFPVFQQPMMKAGGAFTFLSSFLPVVYPLPCPILYSFCPDS